MKRLRIVFLLMFSVLPGAWLSATESVVLENEQPVLTPKTAQADTVRMTWEVSSSSYYRSFSFYGEKGATYEVDWGDLRVNINNPWSGIPTIETYIGNGAQSRVVCRHRYAESGTYTVLLYGVSK